MCLKTLGYDQRLCDLAFSILNAESSFGTNFYKPEVEKYLHNMSGVKSKAILASGNKANEFGSWLREFSSDAEYYRYYLQLLHDFYWLEGKKTPELVVRKYVGRYSKSWVSNVNFIFKSL